MGQVPWYPRFLPIPAVVADEQLQTVARCEGGQTLAGRVSAKST